MRAISLWQPWATLVVIGQKRYETRSWHTAVRGRVLIHAAKKWDRALREMAEEEPFRTAIGSQDIPLGAIIGAVTIADCERTQDVWVAALEREFGDFYPGRFAWRLEEPVCIDPVSFRGSQGFFDVPRNVLPAGEVRRAIDERLR